jgi:hypothetical protein
VATSGDGTFTVLGTHTYADETAVLSVTVTIHDDGGAAATALSTATVSDAVLSAAGLTIAATEGATFSGQVATFTDANLNSASSDYTSSIVWGDGVTTAGTVTSVTAGAFAVSGSHAYVDETTSLISVTLTDVGGDSVTAASTAHVADAALSVTGMSIAATEGVTFSGTVAIFTDANPDSESGDFTASIDWGDGTSAAPDVTQGSLVSKPGGGFAVTGTHVYSGVANGALVAVSIDDKGGAMSTVNSTVVIIGLPPTANPDTFVLGPGGALSGAGAVSVLANDISADDQPERLVATIVSGAAEGALTLNTDGSFTYSPGPGFHGIDRFSYQVSENGVVGNTVTDTLLSYHASLVDKVYQQVLHRPAEDAGLTYWTGLLDQGQPLDVVASGIFNSTERLNPLVAQFYQQFLGRGTDPGGLAYWVADWQAKGDPRDVVENILASKEFFDDAGDTNLGFINLLYQRVLMRSAEPDGIAYWVALMSDPPNNPPETRAQVASQFYDTHEKHVDLVDFLFGEYFNSISPLPSTQPYVAGLDAGESETQVEKAIIDSPVYSGSPRQPAAGSVGLALYPH